MATKEDLTRVFEDTEKMYKEDKNLQDSIKRSIANTILYMEGNTPSLPDKRYANTLINISKYRSLETAMFYHRKFPNARIGIHNFASATNPGGGVRKGSRAQEEAICRCTTLFPVLDTKTNLYKFYKFHRNRGNSIYTAACIYAPDIQVIKTDDDIPSRLKPDKQFAVDILTMAAPNLRVSKLTHQQLEDIHHTRAKHLLSIAAYHSIDILVLGAFGCGAFQNDPAVVAQAYKDILPEFDGYFQQIDFAVYCTPRDKQNFETFSQILKK